MIEDKTILITGAAGKLGSEFAKSIIKNKGKVILADINLDKLEKLSKEIDSEKCSYIECDVNKFDDIERSINFGVKKYGKINGAIHSAYPSSATWKTIKFENLESKIIIEDISRQLGSAIIFSQRIIKYFETQKSGSLIHVASIHGIASPKFDHYKDTNIVSPIEYSMIKSALISLTKYLAKYYKSLNINCISPGGILENNHPENFIKKYRESCNQKGLLEPNDISSTILYLLSDNSKFITGQNIIIDDGWSL